MSRPAIAAPILAFTTSLFAPSPHLFAQPAVTEQSSGTTEVLQAVSPVTQETVWVSGHAG